MNIINSKTSILNIVFSFHEKCSTFFKKREYFKGKCMVVTMDGYYFETSIMPVLRFFKLRKDISTTIKGIMS